MRLLALLLLAGCPKAPPSRSDLKPGWWEDPDLSDIPLRALADLDFDGRPWEQTARALGLDPASFQPDTWGQYEVKTHPTNGRSLAIYLNRDQSTTYGIIVQSAPIAEEKQFMALVAAAYEARRRETWDLYEDDEYRLLVSRSEPLLEVGCHRFAGCHAIVYGSSRDPSPYPALVEDGGTYTKRPVPIP